MANTTADSDNNIYVLSLPSFRWIRVAQDKSEKLRIKRKCQLAGKHNVLITGGTVPTDDSEYESRRHNCDMFTRFTNGLRMFDLNNHTWRKNWNADDREYTVNSDISKVIGGGYVLSPIPPLAIFRVLLLMDE